MSVLPHSWPQLLILMGVAAKFTGPVLRAAGADVKAPGWFRDTPKYRVTGLIVTTINSVVYILILGYGGFWEALR